MTAYQKVKAAAQAKGIDTRKDTSGGYWLTDNSGKDLYADDNFHATLKDLALAVKTH